MQQSNAPAKIPTAFAASGTKRAPAATSGGISTPEQPSWDVGWPIITETDPLLGGIPPGRQDFNGLGYALSGPAQWAQAGGGYAYDSAFSASIGGYPKGAKLLTADGLGTWQSIVDNNTTNPDAGGTGWVLTPASQIGVQDAAGDWTATNQEGVNAEIGKVLRKWVTATDPRFGGIVSGSWHTAINAAAVYAAANSLGLALLPQSGGYPTNDTVTLPITLLAFDSSGASILYGGPADRPALDIGAITGTVLMYGNYKGISVANQTAHGWTNDLFVGVRVQGTLKSLFEIVLVSGFTSNLQLSGSNTTGVSENTFYIGALENGKYQCDLYGRNIAGNGYVNENIFFGGRYATFSSYPNTLDSYGVIIRNEAGAGYTLHNNNVWIKPAFELQNGNAGVTRCPVRFQTGAFNQVYNARAETGRGAVAWLGGGGYCQNNKIEFGYVNIASGTAFTRLLSEDVVFGNCFGNEATSLMDAFSSLKHTYSISDLQSDAFGVGAGVVAVRGMGYNAFNGSATVYSGSMEILSDAIAITSSGGPSVFVDTTKHKTLIVEKSVPVGFEGIIAVACFNSSGAQLANSTQHLAGDNFSGTTLIGGGWRCDLAMAKHRFSVSDTVAYIKIVFLALSGATCKLSGFRIVGQNVFDGVMLAVGAQNYMGTATNMRVWSDQPIGSEFYCSAKPDANKAGGKVYRGQAFYNSAAAAGVPGYWAASTAGYNAPLWAISTAYPLTGIIRSNGANAYVLRTAGISAGAGGPTGTGTGIADNTCVWDYIGAAAVFVTSANLV